MNNYRWGILGTGIIAHEFAKGLRFLSNAELYSVYNRTFEKAEDFSVKYGFRHTVKEFDSFLKDPKLDIVYIATPNHLHCEHAIRCMEAGKHVLIEKPMALNVSQAEQIIQVSRKNKRFCMEAMWSRFIPVYLKVKALLRQKAIGDAVFLNATFGHPIPYNQDRFRYSLEKGGGSLLDLGVYPISLALMLLGNPERVFGECRKAESE
ncbi:MAG TPA: Gfo/Idh/MocA family oxidoreductase [Balneolaceae bacterium]|nr:Gfo/Idh/MocA family oxidoreductase [Balneolaceae bacterium]